MIRYVIEDDFLLKCPLFHLNCTKDKFSEIVLNFLDLYDMKLDNCKSQCMTI